MAFKNSDARRAYQNEWARRKREAQGKNVRVREDNIVDAIAIDRVVRDHQKARTSSVEKVLIVNRLTGQGYSANEIGELVGIESRTVERYQQDIMAGAVRDIMARIESGDLDVSPDRSAL